MKIIVFFNWTIFFFLYCYEVSGYNTTNDKSLCLKDNFQSLENEIITNALSPMNEYVRLLKYLAVNDSVYEVAYDEQLTSSSYIISEVIESIELAISECKAIVDNMKHILVLKKIMNHTNQSYHDILYNYKVLIKQHPTSEDLALMNISTKYIQDIQTEMMKYTTAFFVYSMFNASDLERIYKNFHLKHSEIMGNIKEYKNSSIYDHIKNTTTEIYGRYIQYTKVLVKDFIIQEILDKADEVMQMIQEDLEEYKEIRNNPAESNLLNSIYYRAELIHQNMRYRSSSQNKLVFTVLRELEKEYNDLFRCLDAIFFHQPGNTLNLLSQIISNLNHSIQQFIHQFKRNPIKSLENFEMKNMFIHHEFTKIREHVANYSEFDNLLHDAEYSINQTLDTYELDLVNKVRELFVNRFQEIKGILKFTYPITSDDVKHFIRAYQRSRILISTLDETIKSCEAVEKYWPNGSLCADTQINSALARNTLQSNFHKVLRAINSTFVWNFEGMDNLTFNVDNLQLSLSPLDIEMNADTFNKTLAFYEKMKLLNESLELITVYEHYTLERYIHYQEKIHQACLDVFKSADSTKDKILMSYNTTIGIYSSLNESKMVEYLHFLEIFIEENDIIINTMMSTLQDICPSCPYIVQNNCDEHITSYKILSTTIPDIMRDYIKQIVETYLNVLNVTHKISYDKPSFYYH